MGDSSKGLQFAAQRVIHELTVQRLVQRIYEQRLIGNVERGPIVEYMIEVTLRERHPTWWLTDAWASWDIEDGKTGARIEVKQSAAWNPFSKRPGRGSFGIQPHRGYFAKDGAGFLRRCNATPTSTCSLGIRRRTRTSPTTGARTNGSFL